MKKLLSIRIMNRGFMGIGFMLSVSSFQINNAQALNGVSPVVRDFLVTHQSELQNVSSNEKRLYNNDQELDRMQNLYEEYLNRHPEVDESTCKLQLGKKVEKIITSANQSKAVKEYLSNLSLNSFGITQAQVATDVTETHTKENLKTVSAYSSFVDQIVGAIEADRKRGRVVETLLVSRTMIEDSFEVALSDFETEIQNRTGIDSSVFTYVNDLISVDSQESEYKIYSVEPSQPISNTKLTYREVEVKCAKKSTTPVAPKPVAPKPVAPKPVAPQPKQTTSSRQLLVLGSQSISRMLFSRTERRQVQ
jgi:hypothetical protein